MTRYLAQRTVKGLITIFVVVSVAFFAANVVGDPVELFTDEDYTTQADKDRLYAAFGLDKPLLERYGDFIWNALQGDLGQSHWQSRGAAEIVAERIPATLQLAGLGLALIVVLSVPLALIAARFNGRWPERTITAGSTALASMAPFWLALGLIFLLAIQLDVFPTSGRGSWDQMVLPVLAVSAFPLGLTTQVMHAAISSEYHQPYVRTARAKGLAERTVAFRHVLRNALVVVLTQVGLITIALLNGSVLIEAVFAWPGLGGLTLAAINLRDVPIVMATVIYVSILVVGVNLIVDVGYSLIDPRIRLR